MAIGTSLLVNAFASNAGASTVVFSNSRIGPRFTTSQGRIVDEGLVLVGTFIGAPESSSIDDIALGFREFGRASTGRFLTVGHGMLHEIVSAQDPSATTFNEEQIYIWVFNTPRIETATEHAVFTSFNIEPATADAWKFPIHIGSGQDFVQIHLPELYTDGDASITPGVLFQGSNDQIILTPIQVPEPTTLPLLACALAAAFRRRG